MWKDLETVQSFWSDAGTRGCPAGRQKYTGRREIEGAREDAEIFPSTRSIPTDKKYTPGPEGRWASLGGEWGEVAWGPPRLRPLLLLLLTPQLPQRVQPP